MKTNFIGPDGRIVSNKGEEQRKMTPTAGAADPEEVSALKEEIETMSALNKRKVAQLLEEQARLRRELTFVTISKDHIEQLTIKGEQLQKRLDDKQLELDDLKKGLPTDERIDRLEKQLKEVEQQRNQLESNTEKLQSENAHLKMQNTELNGRIESLKGDLESLNNNLSTTKRQLAEANTAFSLARQVEFQLRKQLAEAKANAAAASAASGGHGAGATGGLQSSFNAIGAGSIGAGGDQNNVNLIQEKNETSMVEKCIFLAEHRWDQSGLPFAATAISASLAEWNAFQSPNCNALDKILTALDQCVTRDTNDNHALMFWLSLSSSLLYLTEFQMEKSPTIRDNGIVQGTKKDEQMSPPDRFINRLRLYVAAVQETIMRNLYDVCLFLFSFHN